MDNLVIEPAKITTIKIQDTEEKFPVRRVYCIGRNYIAVHKKECEHKKALV